MAESRKIGAHAIEVQGKDDPRARRVHEIAELMNDALPDDANAGEVTGALGRMLLVGIEHMFDHRKDRLQAFDDFMAWHRARLEEAAEAETTQ